MNYSNFGLVDDKYVPLYRVLWIGATPHFCGHDDCEREGMYEIRLEQGESVWSSLLERDELLMNLEKWSGEPPAGAGEDEEWEE